MILNKSILLTILLSLHILTGNKFNKSWICNGNDLEVLNGQVKQLIIRYSDDDDLHNYNVINFDEDGNVIEIRKKSRGISSQSKYETKFDVNGKKVESQYYTRILSGYPADFKIDTIYALIGTYKYDKNGRIYEYIFNQTGTSHWNYRYKYDSFGNIIECDLFVNSHLLMDVTKYRYNNEQILVGTDRFHNDHLDVSITYDYTILDGKGNWMTRISHMKNIYENWRTRIDTAYRKITYY